MALFRQEMVRKLRNTFVLRGKKPLPGDKESIKVALGWLVSNSIFFGNRSHDKN
jgi:hypothetical protein